MTYLRVASLAAGAAALNFIRQCWRVAWDAFYRFNGDDGWAIASHIALSA